MSLDEIEQLFYTRVHIGKLYPDVKAIYDRSEPNSEIRARSALLVGIYFRNNRSNADEYYEEAKHIAEKMNHKRLLSGYFQYRAEKAYRNGNVKDANELIEKALSLSIASNFQYGLCETYSLLGKTEIRYGLHEEGLMHLNKALSIAKEHGLLKRQADILFYLSEFYLSSRDLRRSEAHARNALQVSRELDQNDNIQLSIVRLATVELELKRYAEVTKLITEVRETLPKTNHALWANTHTLTGKVHEAKSQFDEAEQEFHIALSLADFPNSDRVRSNIHFHISELYLKTKRPDQALEHSLAALADAEKAQDMYTRKEALNQLHAVYKELGDYKHAHDYLERYNSLIAESDSALLKTRLEFHALKNEFEQEKIKAETKAKESELLRLNLEYKERELVEKLRHLLQQAETLRQFQKDLRALIRRTPSDDPAVREIRSRLGEFPTKELNWQDFEKEFHDAHPNFLPALSNRFPSLTQMERRVAAMVQMDLKSPDIAQLFSITERAVEFHRLNLRKKLDLKKGEDLHKFLSTL